MLRCEKSRGETDESQGQRGRRETQIEKEADETDKIERRIKKRQRIGNTSSSEGHVIEQRHRSTGTESPGDQHRRILSDGWKQ